VPTGQAYASRERRASSLGAADPSTAFKPQGGQKPALFVGDAAGVAIYPLAQKGCGLTFSLITIA